MFTYRLGRLRAPLWAGLWLLLVAACPAVPQSLAAQPDPPPAVGGPEAVPSPLTSFVHKVHAANERIEMIVNTSRVLTLEQRMPRVEVNNPEIVEVHPLSPNEVQIFAKTAGVTQVNLLGEDRSIYAIDVVVYGDAQRLQMLLRSEFPTAAVKAIPVGTGVLLSGTVEKPEHINRIVQLAEEFYPKILNNMYVCGAQQVVLHLKLMEVSRTKLRQLGIDWATMTMPNLTDPTNNFVSSASGLISGVTQTGATLAGSPTAQLNIIGSGSAFFGVLDALRQDDLLKVLSEPSLVCINGRPGYFNAGGEFPIILPQGLGTVSVDFKKFGTRVDFLPIVMGNGKIHLDVKSVVSELDNTLSVTVGSTTVPGIQSREAETGVEMTAGQTLAIAGLVQTRIEGENKGIPLLADLPYLGAFFRRVQYSNNEIELMIFVTPEFIEASDVAPCGGPGTNSREPNDLELYGKGQLEVPLGTGAACGRCGGGAGGGPCLTPAAYTTSPAGAACPDRPATPGPASGELLRDQPRANPAAGNGNAPPAAADRNSAAAPVNPQTRYSYSAPQNLPAVSPAAGPNAPPGLIGPVGYDVK
jgi:pilus assembly protein CpaC